MDTVDCHLKGISNFVGAWGKKYEDFASIMSLEEFNCKDKTNRVLQSIFYTKEGKVIYRSKKIGEWIFIVPETMPEIIYKELCK